MIRDQHEIMGLLQKMMTKAAGYQARVTYSFERELATRFAENAITQNMGGSQELVRISLARDGRLGAASTNKLDTDSLAELVTRAADVCSNSPVDPEYMPPVGPQEYTQTSPLHFADTAGLGPDDLAGELAGVVAQARYHGYQASGLIQANERSYSLVDSAGLQTSGEWTDLAFTTTMHGSSGSGYACTSSGEAAAVDVQATAGLALANAISAQDPVDIEPGDYTVVFEPQAVLDLLQFLLFNLDARQAAEGVTAFSDCLGKKLFSDRVNLSLEVSDPNLPQLHFGVDGLARRQTSWVRNGVLERLYHDRYWASQQGESPDAAFTPLYMSGEDQTLADLIAGCKKGLLVKRLWYVRYVDRRELLLTGMTRDGLFMIEDGAVTRPVKNLRFNESPLTFLRNIEALSQAERVLSWSEGVVPGVRSGEFTFSSKTESV
jgi:predicted Zn-dependent protease